MFKKAKRYRELLSTARKMGLTKVTRRFGIHREIDFQVEFDNPKFAKRFREGLESLGATFIKFGQIMSTRVDIFPKTLIAELEKLQDSVLPVSFKELKPSLEQELKEPIEEVFSYINEIPLASASLGQVHEATLQSGEQVVLKILKPGIPKQVSLDCEIILELAQQVEERTAWGKHNHIYQIIYEFVITLQSELDFQREGLNAERLREIHRDSSFIYIPKIYWDYSTPKLLVMEKIQGIKINQRDKLVAAGYDPSVVIKNNLHRLVIEAIGEGFFHADPHSGNFLVMDDHVLGMLDFGIIGNMDTNLSMAFLKFLWATLHEDIPEVIKHLETMGFLPEDVDREQLSRDLQRFVGYYFKLPINRFPMQGLINDLYTVLLQYNFHFPVQIALLLKTLSMIEGLIVNLAPDTILLEEIRPFLKEQLLRKESIINLAKTMGSRVQKLTDQSMELPGKVNTLLDIINRGKLVIGLEEHSMDHVIIHLKGIINRFLLMMLTVSLVLATALILPNFEGETYQLIQNILVIVGVSASTILAGYTAFVFIHDIRKESKFHEKRKYRKAVRLMVDDENHSKNGEDS